MTRQAKKGKKVLHKVFRVGGKYNTFIEFGWVENPTFNNEIYLMVVSKHKGGDDLKFLRIDEALIFIEGLARAVNAKVTGMNIEYYDQTN